ncbi:hypothetical protein Hanom_Chr03g00260791 [Helianthus anomalus]
MFSQFCHFSPNLKPFASGFLWFRFCCHFSPKAKSTQISRINPAIFSFSSGAKWPFKQ